MSTAVDMRFHFRMRLQKEEKDNGRTTIRHRSTCRRGHLGLSRRQTKGDQFESRSSTMNPADRSARAEFATRAAGRERVAGVFKPLQHRLPLSYQGDSESILTALVFADQGDCGTYLVIKTVTRATNRTGQVTYTQQCS
jgi:hypothetical protein